MLLFTTICYLTTKLVLRNRWPENLHSWQGHESYYLDNINRGQWATSYMSQSPVKSMA